jgi:predicted dehydrogenase
LEADNFGEFRLLVRDGDIISPRVDTSEPLKTLGAHFLDCIVHNKSPLSDGENGLAVVKVMSAIDKSLEQNGSPVEVV